MWRILAKYMVVEARLLWSACAVALLAFCWVRVWLVAHLDMTRFRAILENMPKRWERFSPIPFEQLFTYEGRIAMAYEEPIVYFIVAVWAIARGSDCISGNLGKGTLELALAAPVSRTQWLVTHSSISVIGVVLLACTAWLGTSMGILVSSVRIDPSLTAANFPLAWATGAASSEPATGEGVHQPLRALVDARTFMAGARNFAALGFCLLGLASALGCADQYRWRTIGLSATVVVLQMVLEIVGMAADGCHWLRMLTIFSVYEPVAITMGVRQQRWGAWQWYGHDAVRLGPLACDAVLLMIGGIGLGLAWYWFRRRDLPAPL